MTAEGGFRAIRPGLPRAPGAGRALAAVVRAVPAAAAAALLLIPAVAGPAHAQQAGAGLPPDTGAPAAPDDPRVDSLTARVASQLRCPVCRSQSVLESSSELANRMQAVIRDRLARGDSPADVRAYFVDKYGEWILLRPEPEGLNLLVYVLPAVAVLGGGWVVARTLRGWSTEGPADGDAPGPGGGEGRQATDSRRGDLASDLDGLSEDDREWLRREMDARR